MRSSSVVALLTCCALGWVACTRSPTPEPPPLTGPLHRAAWSGDSAALRAAIDGGARVDEKDRSSEWTALHAASVAGRAEAANLLLERGADPNARGRFDLTPLHWAALRGRVEVAALLARRGANLDARNMYGMTPLHEAADERVVAVLVAAGADVKAVDHRGMTPLHVARNKRVARALLEQGADMTMRTREGRTAWETAAWDQLEPHGLTILAARASARLRGDEARTEISVRNVGATAAGDLVVAGRSAACTVVVTPGRVPALQPGQLATYTLHLRRKGTTGDGEHPLSLTASAQGRPLGTIELRVDTTRGETPEDRGEIRLGRGALRPPATRWQYVVYAVVPLLMVAGWLVWRRRR